MGWVIHYKDGSSRDESEGVDWTDIPKDDAAYLQIVKKWAVHTLKVPDINYGVFQFKYGITCFGRPDLNRPMSERVIGVVINTQGDCLLISVDEQTEKAETRIDNVYDLGISFKKQQLKLEEHDRLE